MLTVVSTLNIDIEIVQVAAPRVVGTVMFAHRRTPPIPVAANTAEITTVVEVAGTARETAKIAAVITVAIILPPAGHLHLTPRTIFSP